MSIDITVDDAIRIALSDPRMVPLVRNALEQPDTSSFLIYVDKDGGVS